MYTIEVSYRTGNSFGSEDCEDTIGLCWEDKELAREALKVIQEHYKLYIEADSCNYMGFRDKSEIYAEVSTKEWFIKAKEEPFCKKSEYDWHYFCVTKMDDGTYRNIPTNMWCGYFERLHSARVICTEADEDYIEFN